MYNMLLILQEEWCSVYSSVTCAQPQLGCQTLGTKALQGRQIMMSSDQCENKQLADIEEFTEYDMFSNQVIVFLK